MLVYVCGRPLVKPANPLSSEIKKRSLSSSLLFPHAHDRCDKACFAFIFLPLACNSQSPKIKVAKHTTHGLVEMAIRYANFTCFDSTYPAPVPPSVSRDELRVHERAEGDAAGYEHNTTSPPPTPLGTPYSSNELAQPRASLSRSGHIRDLPPEGRKKREKDKNEARACPPPESNPQTRMHRMQGFCKGEWLA